MNIGERIQLLRKHSGMSQEDLGQKLLVSRQTVSLWETGQTYPTIDNLIRLKEIFGISLDELIDGDNLADGGKEVNVKLPNESYGLNYDSRDIREASGIIYGTWRRIVACVVCNIIVILLSFYIASYNPGLIIIGLAADIGYNLRVIKYFKTVKKNKAAWINGCSRQNRRLDVYDDTMIYTVYENEETVKMIKIPYLEIETVKEYKNYIFFIHNGVIYTVKKSDLAQESVLYSLKSRRSKTENHEKKEVQTPSYVKALKAVFIAVSVLSLFMSLIALAMVTLWIDIESQGAVEYFWVMYLFIPLPLASLILGRIWRKKGYGGMGNIVIGIIMTVILALYGSFTFIIPVNHSNEHFVSVEERMEMDFPDYKYIEMVDYTKDGASKNYGSIYMKYESTVFFYEDDLDDMVNMLKNDGRFLDYIPSNLKCLLPIGTSGQGQTMFLCFDDGRVNQLPDQTGKYNYICMVFNVDKGRLDIFEYAISYVK